MGCVPPPPGAQHHAGCAMTRFLHVPTLRRVHYMIGNISRLTSHITRAIMLRHCDPHAWHAIAIATLCFLVLALHQRARPPTTTVLLLSPFHLPNRSNCRWEWASPCNIVDTARNLHFSGPITEWIQNTFERYNDGFLLFSLTQRCPILQKSPNNNGTVMEQFCNGCPLQRVLLICLIYGLICLITTDDPFLPVVPFLMTNAIERLILALGTGAAGD